MISDNIKSVTQRIASACERSGRSPDSVKLICVTKTRSISEIREAMAAGVVCLGENRVQDAVLKFAALGEKAEWHLIGHLQTNKVRDAVRIFSLIHSVDSLRLAQAINKEAARAGKTKDILIQVNTSGEASKFGLNPQDLTGLIKEAITLPNIHINGLMTIAPEASDPETVRPYFKALRELRDEARSAVIPPHALSILSMGMTGDFEVAVEEGSDMVRIGRAIFGDAHDR